MSLQKKKTLTVEGWQQLKEGKRYKGSIKQIRVGKKTKSLHVTIKNLDPTQSGRIHDIVLPLPIHPGNRTSRFLAAAGIEANTVGKQICIDDIAGNVVGMRFTAVAGNGNQQIEFERIANPPDIKVDTLVKESRNEADMS